jgi:hypothetical protein
VEFTGLVVYRIKNGRIAESWGEIDFQMEPAHLTVGAIVSSQCAAYSAR